MRAGDDARGVVSALREMRGEVEVMGICWYCHWGWPPKVSDIYNKAMAALGGDPSPLHFGPSHIVWEDENFDCAKWCLDNFDEYSGDYSEKELAVVKRSLEELDYLPDADKFTEPEDYDDEHPELYPPSIPHVRHQ